MLAWWVVDACAAIPEAMVAAPFRKCCISNALEGIEDSDLFVCKSNKDGSDDTAYEEEDSS